MDHRGGCCIARYAGVAAYDTSKVDQIMLRFRPIAPKPAAPGGGSPAECNESPARCAKARRRYGAREVARRLGRKRKAAVVTLPLLPEAPVGRDPPAGDESDPAAAKAKPPKSRTAWVSSDGDNVAGAFGAPSDRAAGSCVTVECVTDAWGDGGALGRTDEERRRNLERDSCPGFVSDAWNRVRWTNGAYKRMVGEEEGGGGGGPAVVMKEMLPWTHAAFACRVRVQYSCGTGNGQGQERSSLTLPADVWRMDAGGFAWRLDVDAALSLGRSATARG